MQSDPFISRESNSPFIYRVWEAHFSSEGELTVTADGTWDIVFSRYKGKTTCSITGPTTGVVTYSYHAGQWALGMQFREGVYLPSLPASEVINATRPLAADNAKILLEGHSFVVPDYDGVEDFVDQLYHQKLIARDVVIERALEKGDVQVPKRSVQRHFTGTTGIPLSRHKQIQRAQKAAKLLRNGTTIADVVVECGYYDQAHLTKSLKQFLGATPEQIRHSQ